MAFLGYDRTKPNDKENQNSFVHFFLDDYKFEVIHDKDKVDFIKGLKEELKTKRIPFRLQFTAFVPYTAETFFLVS